MPDRVDELVGDLVGECRVVALGDEYGIVVVGHSNGDDVENRHAAFTREEQGQRFVLDLLSSRVDPLPATIINTTSVAAIKPAEMRSVRHGTRSASDGDENTRIK